MLNLLLSKEDPVNLHVLGVANKIARSLTKGHFQYRSCMVQKMHLLSSAKSVSYFSHIDEKSHFRQKKGISYNSACVPNINNFGA